MTSYERAAAAAGVTIRELREVAEFEDVFRLFDDIWHPGPANVPVPVELMVGLSHTGSYVAGAYEGERLVGASVGFLAADRALHSHVTGATIGRGIGSALKLHQREWALEHGLERITWTFDPLVRRNARFNLAKLGARPEEYVEDFYGSMADKINEGDYSDRLVAVWRLTEEPVPVPAGPYGRAVVADGDLPRRLETGERVRTVATPKDVEALRQSDPGAAREWRLAVREVLGGLMRDGGRVVGFTADGEYVVSVP